MKFQRPLPDQLQALHDLAADTRWTWNHAGDQLWRAIDPELWQSLKNPYAILQTTPTSRFEELAKDRGFLTKLQIILRDRQQYRDRVGWYQAQYADEPLQKVAYFCMEYGLGEALPLYAGGLGILAGDYLKAASDLCVPTIGVGLLFDQGYFRQTLDASGWQQELYPNCDTSSLPISPVLGVSGDWLQVTVELPGRLLILRIWEVKVGNVSLYLLDSNHPKNNLADQGICNQLYPAQAETRFIQQFVLGVGGWRALRAMAIPVDICHLNEAHSAFVVLERINEVMANRKLGLDAALLLVRAGNILTTHTPIAAAFDRFPVAMVEKYFSTYAQQFQLPSSALMALGIDTATNSDDNFSAMTLAQNGCITINAVSQSHRCVVQKSLRTRYPRWPDSDIPVIAITNGVHMPSWDSAWADQLWTEAAGKSRWLGDLSNLQQAMDCQCDERLWALKSAERADLIGYVRQRFAASLVQRGASEADILAANNVLDPNVLTLGFARRFTEYKRPNLLLQDMDRLARLLSRREEPVQIILAGKAHPLDREGKVSIQQWVAFSQQQQVHNHVVYLPDYDISLAQELVQGVDVWISTPRHPWEACGTSGMKVLANGGLNLSELDGWWAEGYRPECGWAIGDRQEHQDLHWDEIEAEQLYQCLENDVIPEFYRRDGEGLPRDWLKKIRASMAELAPQYSSNRMVREYVEKLYLGTARRFHQRNSVEDIIGSLLEWQQVMNTRWREIRWGKKYTSQNETGFELNVQVYLGSVPAHWVQIELYAEAESGQLPERITLQRKSDIVGTVGGYLYQGFVETSRPQAHYTPRIFAWHENASLPIECNRILWWCE